MKANDSTGRIACERASQQIATAFVSSGLLFMLLPGTFLGVWNLIAISLSRHADALEPARLQAHGHAQLFGWVGSFIIGIGFYSLTKTQSTLDFRVRSGWAAWTCWTIGITLRWVAGMTFWHWRMLLPLSAGLELAGFSIFALSVRRHSPPHRSAPPEKWMRLVIAATLTFLIALVVNLAITIRVAIWNGSPELPYLLDQEFVLLVLWGVLVPMIWGFNARWLRIFGGFQDPDSTSLLIAYLFSIVGIVCLFSHVLSAASLSLLISGLCSVHALHIWDPSVRPAKTLGVHSSLPVFLRLPYLWLVLSSILFAVAVTSDRNGGIWGASRHAITVGFVAGMVFAIGPRILPSFCGMRILWSRSLMLWSLVLLHLGCALRVTLQPFAYETNAPHSWTGLAASAFIELAAVVLFALNLIVTLLRAPAHLAVPSSGRSHERHGHTLYTTIPAPGRVSLRSTKIHVSER